jgi:hypothetical protein
MNLKTNGTYEARDSYKLTAIPVILSEGAFKGHLEYVMFRATAGGVTKKMFMQNRADLVKKFNRLVDLAEAEAIVATLRRGEDLVLPGTFTFDQLTLFGFRDEA